MREARLLRTLVLQGQGDRFGVAQQVCKTRKMSPSRADKNSDL